METELKQYYIAIDNNNGHILGEYETINELYHDVDHYARKHYCAYFSEMFVMSIAAVDVTPAIVWFDDNNHINWVGTNHGISTRKNIYVLDANDCLVDIVHLMNMQERKRRSRWYNRKENPHRAYKDKIEDIIGNNLSSRKHNVNKIKTSYLHKARSSNFTGEIYWWFADESYWHYPRTIAAIRASLSVEKDEGEPLFRGKRNSNHLPTVWDDKTTGRWYTKNSWKHNSKRRKQWKPK